MDGYLKIKTKLDNSEIDKDVEELENKINKLQTDNAKSSSEQKELEAEINRYEKLQQEADKYRQKISNLNEEKQAMFAQNGFDKALPSSEMSNYNKVNSELTKIRAKYSNINSEINKQAPAIEKTRIKLDKVKTKQTENNAKIQQFKDKIEAIKIDRTQGQINNIGKAIQGQISKIGKMAMAVVGVRTAYSAVRRAISMVSQYNSQISTDIEYMRYCIANALAPAIQSIIKLLYTALSYINAITTAWFGINLFSGASVKNFQKMQSSASGTAKSAKEIQKSLQGFDEMNVLSDTSNTSAGSSVSTPSMDLSGIQGEVPKWLQWIIDNKALILATLGTIATIIGTMKIASFIDSFDNAPEIFTKFNAGILLIIAGIAMLSGSIINMILNWDEMTTKEKIISVALAAIGAAFIALGYAIAAGISAATLGIGAIIAAVVALVTAVGTLIFKWASEEEAILSVADAQKNLEEATKNLENANNSYIDSVDKVEEANQRLAEAEAKCGMSGKELFDQVQQGTLDYKDMTAEQKELYKAYLDNETAQKQLEEAANALMEAKQQEKIASWENKLATMAEAEQYDEYKQAVVDAFNSGELSAEEARDLIGKSMSEMSRDSQKTFMEDLPGDIKNGLDPKNYETTGQKISKWFGNVWQGIKDVFSHVGDWFKNTFSKAWQAVKNVFSTGGKIFDGIKDGILSGLKTVINAIIGAINKVIAVPFNGINTALRGIKGIEILGLKPFSWINTISVPQIPKLAKGGVISQPTQAIIGEAGREAVVPLENNMEWLDILADKLASKIGTSGGSYIIQMDGRTIQRGMAKRRQELAFATNGR